MNPCDLCQTMDASNSLLMRISTHGLLDVDKRQRLFRERRFLFPIVPSRSILGQTHQRNLLKTNLWEWDRSYFCIIPRSKCNRRNRKHLDFTTVFSMLTRECDTIQMAPIGERSRLQNECEDVKVLTTRRCTMVNRYIKFRAFKSIGTRVLSDACKNNLLKLFSRSHTTTNSLAKIPQIVLPTRRLSGLHSRTFTARVTGTPATSTEGTASATEVCNDRSWTTIIHCIQNTR